MANSDDQPMLRWNRPDSADFPRIWHTFKARDIDSDNLVEYRIQDLPMDRADDFFQHMLATFIPDEPIGHALGGENDPEYFQDFKLQWEIAIKQRITLVCFKEGSTEIVGANVLYIRTKEDDFPRALRKTFKGYVSSLFGEVVGLLQENYNAYEAYKVDKLMGTLGLSVDRRCRGRGIGDQFLITRKAVCREFGIQLTQTAFTSDFSNKSADRAGFITDVALNYAEIIEKYPKFRPLANIKSKQLTLKSLII